jgi:hypothetical protein
VTLLTSVAFFPGASDGLQHVQLYEGVEMDKSKLPNEMIDVTLEECLDTVDVDLDISTAKRICDIAKISGETFKLEYVPEAGIFYLKHDGAIVLETMCLEYALVAALAFSKMPAFVDALDKIHERTTLAPEDIGTDEAALMQNIQRELRKVFTDESE